MTIYVTISESTRRRIYKVNRHYAMTSVHRRTGGYDIGPPPGTACVTEDDVRREVRAIADSAP